MSAAGVHTSLSLALDMARVGYYLAPVTLRRGPDGKKRAHYYGSWDEQSTRDPDKIRDWYVQHECSFLVDCGKSGIVGVDLDLKNDRDGIASWQAAGGPHGGIVVDTLSGGQHHYFAADPDRPLTNSADQKTGVDVRGEGGHLYAPGAFILGTDGQPEPGTYTARGPLYTPGDLPPAPEILHQARKVASPNAGLPREDRSFTLAQAREYCRVKLDELSATQEGGRNHALNTAAFRLGHFVADHFGTSYEAAEKALLKALPEGYGDAPGEKGEILATIRSGLTDGIEDGVYVRAESETGSAYEQEDPAARRERLVAAELEKLEVREEARRRLQPKEPLRVLRGAAFLTEGAELKYLVRRFLYETSTAKIYGPPGGGKTNFALDIALCAATGTDWHGVKIERCVVHFVMAEGEPVNRLRVAAFLHRHTLAPQVLDDWFVAIPQGVLLTPTGVADYLDVVRKDKPGLVFLDTKNAMMDGDENSASDVAVMIRAMREIRDSGQRCCVALIDHTGIADESRGRGSNAVMAAMDTEIKVSKQRVGDADVYTALVTRDKAAAETDPARFDFTLWPQQGVDRPEGVAAPPVVNTEDEVIKHLDRETGPRAEDVEEIIVPPDVVGYRGEGHQLVVEVAETILRHGRGETGITRAEVVAVFVRDVPTRERNKVRMRVYRAWDALYGMGRLAPVNPETSILTSYTKWV